MTRAATSAPLHFAAAFPAAYIVAGSPLANTFACNLHERVRDRIQIVGGTAADCAGWAA